MSAPAHGSTVCLNDMEMYFELLGEGPSLCGLFPRGGHVPIFDAPGVRFAEAPLGFLTGAPPGAAA